MLKKIRFNNENTNEDTSGSPEQQSDLPPGVELEEDGLPPVWFLELGVNGGHVRY